MTVIAITIQGFELTSEQIIKKIYTDLSIPLTDTDKKTITSILQERSDEMMLGLPMIN